MTDAKLYLVCGLPGSGKTTFAKELERQTDAIRMCPDEWMVSLQVSIFDSDFRDVLEKQMTEMSIQILRQGGRVIIEFGSWGRAERDLLRVLAHQNQAKVELYWLEVSIPELSKRIQTRGGEDALDLTEEYLQETSNRIERPTPDEGKLFDKFSLIEG